MSPEPMYTVDAAATELAVKAETVRRYIRTGKLAAYDIGGSYRIKASDLDAYIEANKITTKNGDSQ